MCWKCLRTIAKILDMFIDKYRPVAHMFARYSTHKDLCLVSFIWHTYDVLKWLEHVVYHTTANFNGYTDFCWKVSTASHDVYHLRPKLSCSSLPHCISSNGNAWFTTMWRKTSLMPVFSRWSSHLVWTDVPPFSSSIVLSLYLKTHVGLLVLLLFSWKWEKEWK